MSWTDARRYHRILREVERELDEALDGRLPWRPEYADLFPTPYRLYLALRSRWTTILRAQGEDRNERELRAEHRGLVCVLGLEPLLAVAS